ncbi:MAG: organoarsenical effux MFS transporter ArsJ [Nitrospiria bacterium]
MQNSKSFLSIALSYLGFSVTDGALRMLVVLYFHNLGFSPFQVASLFLLYEIAGIVTNFIGGWIGSILGLNITLIAGMLLQVVSMGLLTVDNAFLTVPYIMLMQGFSGIAKDLVKMSSKSSLKVLNTDGKESSLFRWVSLLTGSKNALKGVGFLLGGVFLTQFGFQFSMGLMALTLLALTMFTIISLPKNLGKSEKEATFKSLFSKSKAINILSLARFFLFGSRDIWFVIGLPVFLQVGLGWSYSSVGAFLASWIIGYGLAQTLVPKFIAGDKLTSTMGSKSVAFWTGILILFPACIALSLNKGFNNELIIIIGLLSYGIVFAINSIIHSYLVLAYSDDESVSTDVGFYYMANASGRLVGTLISGWVFQSYGFVACLWWSVGFLMIASIISLKLPKMDFQALEI